MVFFSEKVTVLPSTVKELPSAASRHSFHLPCTVSNCSMYAVQDGVYVYQDGVYVYACTYTAAQDGVRACRETHAPKHARALMDVHTNVHAHAHLCIRDRVCETHVTEKWAAPAEPRSRPISRCRAGGLREPLLLCAGGRAPEVLAPPLISLTCTICRLGYLRGHSAGSRHRCASQGAEGSVEEGGTGRGWNPRASGDADRAMCSLGAPGKERRGLSTRRARSPVPDAAE